MLKYINPLTWLQWMGQLFYLWLLAMRWREVPKAIPAIVLLVVISMATVAAWTDDAGWRSRAMKGQLRNAIRKDDFATAELILRRQLNARPDDLEVAFKLALARDQQLAHDEALEMMRHLIDVWQYKDAAQFVLEKEYIGKNWAELSEAQREEFGSVLKLLNEKSPNDNRIKQLYADYLIVAEKLELALPILEELSVQFPMRGFQGAAIARRLEQFATADRLASQCLSDVKRMSDEDPTNSSLAMAVAQNQLFLNQHADAVRTIKKAAGAAKTKEAAQQLNQAMGDAIAAWVGYLEDSPENTAAERARILMMLEFALKTAPNNPRVLTLIADQVLKTLTDDDAEIVRRRKALIAGAAPGIQHFIAGTSALMKDDTKTAVMHLKIASELMPHSGAIMNNLAVALSSRKDADLEQALKISELAIKQTPNASPHFYETRGQILVQLGRYLDAVPDLERAKAVAELAPLAHQSLAKCYAELGQEELSKEHEAAAKKMAEVLKAKAKEANR